MFNLQVKNNPNFNSIPFGSNNNSECNAQYYVASSEKDSFENNAGIKSPSISNLHAFAGIFTDEQIAQINKSKKLPENLRFVYIDPLKWQYGQPWREPYYRICIHNPITDKGTPNLPEGYEVKKSLLVGTCAVKIENS